MSTGVDLRIEGVTVRFADGARAVDGVSIAISAGQFCVILGASGAGKSTLLRTVNGLVRPSEGRVLIGGTIVERATLAALRARIGMIHQHFGLAQRASVATNLIAGIAPDMPLWRALSGAWPAAHRARACALLAAVGLDEAHLARRADRLSGGQQQRVGIARAFMRDPALILADEPVASLDPRSAHEILDLLRGQARSRGATVLCSLHQLDLARAFADRIVALAAGRVVFDGTPDAFHGDVALRVYGAPRLEAVDMPTETPGACEAAE
jgi:phosphonate transport system ATP-binding protein